jgi:hypothetical protein
MSQHPKRPRDPNQWAKRITDIVSGEVEDREPTPEEQGKDPAAVALGRKGGVCTENLHPDVVVMKSAKDRV